LAEDPGKFRVDSTTLAAEKNEIRKENGCHQSIEIWIPFFAVAAS
jgi:hypothetical protein